MIKLKELKLDEWLLVLTGLLISTLHIDLFYYAYDAPKWFIFDAFLSVFLILNIKFLKDFKLSTLGISLALTLTYCCISSFWAPNTGSAVEFCYRFLLVLLTSHILITKNNDDHLYKLITTIIIVSTISFVFLFYVERYLLETETNVGSFSPLGFINNAGQVFNIWIPILILATFYFRKNMLMLMILVPTVIALVSILMEASVRGCIIGLFLGEAMVFCIMLWKDKKKAFLFLSTSMLLLVGIGSYKFFDALDGGKLSNKIAAMENAISPSNGRIKIYSNSIDMIIDNPLGVGSNNFEYIHPKYGKPGTDSSSPFINEHQILRTPHNIFFKFYTEQGLIGGSFFLLSLILLYIRAIINAFKGSFNDRWVLVAITALLFHSLLSAVFLTPGSLFFSILIFSIVAKRSYSLSNIKEKASFTSRPAVLAIPAFIITTSSLSLASNAYAYLGHNLVSPDHLITSLKFNPYNERALFTLSHVEYRKNRDVNASLEAINKFIKINPYHLSANYVKSERLFQTKKYAEANRVVTELLNIYPGYLKAQRLAQAIRKKLH